MSFTSATMNLTLIFLCLSMTSLALGINFGQARQQREDEANAAEAVQLVRYVEAAELASSVGRSVNSQFYQTPYPAVFPSPSFAYLQPHFSPHLQFSRHLGGFYHQGASPYLYPAPQARHYVFRVFNSNK